jgi:hypothetical protein
MFVPKSATRLPGEGSSRPFAGPPEGGLVPLEATVFTLTDALLGPGTTGFAFGTGLLLSEAAIVFALPRALFASRIGSAILTIATLLRSVLTVLIHHCRHNNSNIPSVRKHL